ncbi:MAG: hypothetical protein JSW33_08525 [bacterium]|nr:MAG: hypothetical protein JSW33_08525 [bacterium]
MHKVNFNKILIVAGTILSAIIFIIATVKIYNLSLSEQKRSHQLKQMEMAKATSLGINTHLEDIVEDMRLITFFEEIQKLDTLQLNKIMTNFFRHYEKETVRSIFIADKHGNVLYAKGGELPAWILRDLKNSSVREGVMENFEGYWVSPVQPDAEYNFRDHSNMKLSFFILVPIVSAIYHETPRDKRKDLVGLVGYQINFDLLMQRFIVPLRLGPGDFAWVLDGNGRLIYHPRHEEMLLHSIKKTTPECKNCHSSFNIQNKMLTSPASLGEYKIGTEPPKIMAYFPIQLHKEKWILVISTLLPEVTAGLREKFRLFFILGIIILIVIATLGILLYLVNTKRILAEEARKQSEQMQELQQQLNHASKLASIGELVDTVAHEINTPAGIITAQADAALLQMKEKSAFTEELNIIKNQTQRISKYTRSLLGYSKRLPFNPVPTNLKELLDESVYLLGHRFRAKRITVKKFYKSKLPLLLLDRNQMEQVFINILNNAVDAIEGPGEIKIKAEIITTDLKSGESLNGKEIKIEFIDDGEGIPPVELNNLFKPFFSTKLPREGTGLGLYISKSIIVRHRGKIGIESDPEKGTRVYITFPVERKEN